MCDSNKENNNNTVEIDIDIASQMGLPEGWKVTKTRKDYDITHPDGSKFSGDIDSLAGYLGMRIYYNRRIYQETTEFESISSVDDNNNGAQEICITKYWRVNAGKGNRWENIPGWLKSLLIVYAFNSG